VPISFSAGVDNQNFADCAAAGFVPITTCTDLLRPGGYGRLPKYLDNLEEKMRALGVRNIGDYVVMAGGHAEAAVRQALPESEERVAALQALTTPGADLTSVLGAESHARVVHAAALLNTPAIVARATENPRYRAAAHRTPPRKLGTKLTLFDCVNCDKCLPVCPNDANFAYETSALRAESVVYLVQDGRVVSLPGGVFEVKKTHQIANFQDFCNECGNCDVFCPEDGGPYIEKPRFFGSLAAWQRFKERDGFFVLRQDDIDAIWGRIRGREYHLEVDRPRDRGLFTDGAIALETRHASRQPTQVTLRAAAAEGHRLELSAYLNMALVVDGVLDARRSNPVNALH
jgi:putative selenate reductase